MITMEDVKKGRKVFDEVRFLATRVPREGMNMESYRCMNEVVSLGTFLFDSFFPDIIDKDVSGEIEGADAICSIIFALYEMLVKSAMEERFAEVRVFARVIRAVVRAFSGDATESLPKAFL